MRGMLLIPLMSVTYPPHLDFSFEGGGAVDFMRGICDGYVTDKA